MNSISQTLKFMLLHSKVNLIILLMLMVLVLSFQFKINMHEFPAMMLNSGVAIFLGVYLGGSYLKLKQSYLWLINDRYKLSLLFSFIIIIGVYDLIMSVVILKDMKSFQLLILPFCIAIFSSQIVLGKNLLIKVVIPIIPFVIVKYAYGNMHQSMVYTLVIGATAVLLYSMYTGSIFSLKANKKSKNSKSANTIAFVTEV
ncbi:MAG: hypothetical protein L3J83_09610 [Proteobacteria bacterium]|nr:hypothetical protein [Pseudomonadota bacterium]